MARAATTSDFPLALLSLLIVASVVTAATLLLGYPLIPQGPGLQNTKVTKSLVNNASLEPIEFRRTHEQLKKLSKETNNEYWQDIYSISTSGQLLPKHSLLTVFLSVPFYFLFGDTGFWILNLLSACLLLYSLDYISRSLLKSPFKSSFTTLCILFVGTQTVFYLNSYSYDLIAGALIISGLALSKTRPFLGALIMSLTIHIRLAHILLVPFLMFAWPRDSRKDHLYSLCGLCAVLASLLLLNQLFYGNPLSSPYHNIPLYRGEEMVLQPHPVGFSLPVLAGSWWNKLFSTQNGLLLYNFSLLFLPASYCCVEIRQSRQFYLFTCLAALLYITFIFSYPYWSSTAHGNRFLFPSILLLIIPVTVALHSGFGRDSSSAAAPNATEPLA